MAKIIEHLAHFIPSLDGRRWIAPDGTVFPRFRGGDGPPANVAPLLGRIDAGEALEGDDAVAAREYLLGQLGEDASREAMPEAQLDWLRAQLRQVAESMDLEHLTPQDVQVLGQVRDAAQAVGTERERRAEQAAELRTQAREAVEAARAALGIDAAGDEGEPAEGGAGEPAEGDGNEPAGGEPGNEGTAPAEGAAPAPVIDDPDASRTTDPGGPAAEGQGAGEAEGTAEPIAAGGNGPATTRPRASLEQLANYRLPSAERRPESLPTDRFVMVASAAAPGILPDQELTARQLDTLLQRQFALARRMSPANGEMSAAMLPVAQFQRPFPEDARLDGENADHNEGVMTSLTAAGGPCAFPEVDYGQETIGTNATPWEGSLPQAQATNGRAGLRFPSTPTIDESDYTPGMGVWTQGMDRAAVGSARTVTDAVTTNGDATVTSDDGNFTPDDEGSVASGPGIPPGTTILTVTDEGEIELSAPATVTDADGMSLTITPPTKPCVRIECGDEITVLTEVWPLCVKVGNWMLRAFPERVAAVRRLIDVQYARVTEARLLAKYDAHDLVTKRTEPQLLGAARDVLAVIEKAALIQRDVYRMADGEVLQGQAHRALRTKMVVDLMREMPGSTDDRLRAANGEIDGLLAAHGVAMTWTMEEATGGIFSKLADDGSDLPAIPDVLPIRLFPRGTVNIIDEGTLDLSVQGPYRDHSLNVVNDAAWFMERFLQLYLRGTWALKLSPSTCATGETAGTLADMAAAACA